MTRRHTCHNLCRNAGAIKSNHTFTSTIFRVRIFYPAPASTQAKAFMLAYISALVLVFTINSNTKLF